MSKYVLALIFLFICSFNTANAQLADSCKLDIGINLAGVHDYSRELPFANLMKMSRNWYTKGENDPTYTFNTDLADSLTYTTNGYPTHIPQNVIGEPLPQRAATIWDGTDSWPTGRYVLLWDGTGDFDFWGDYSNLVKINDNRYEFDYIQMAGGILELIMTQSDIANPVDNIRLLLPGTENTYQTQPFNPDWLALIDDFSTLRFMDWGHTNGWGQPDPYTWQIPTLVDWDERAKVDYFTYSTNKGVPYELMIELMNLTNKHGWICVPHLASDDYISEMANFFRDQLQTDLQLHIEYSNELWNWIFGQAQWVNEYGCNGGASVWPECIVPKIQNTLDIWSNSFAGQLDRIKRVAAIQTGWFDVSERIIYNLTPNSFDVISPTFYFSFNDTSDGILDNLGSNATVADIAYHTRLGIPQNFEWIKLIKTISDSTGVPLAFYEGGQHLTPTPFGALPTYETALEDIQRDTAMYNMYNVWLDSIRTLNTSQDKMLLMHFSLVSSLSAQYGSWGLLESMGQDTSLTYAPKYSAILNNISCENDTPVANYNLESTSFRLYPNPTIGTFSIEGINTAYKVKVIDPMGKVMQSYATSSADVQVINISSLPAGLYLISVETITGERMVKKVIKF